MTFPPDIEQVFFETLNGDKSIREFENWLYNESLLESILDDSKYLELISLGYKGRSAKYELSKLLLEIVDKTKYENWRIRRLLTKAAQRDEELPQILLHFYDLYCKGYSFLDNLGLGYGLAIAVPYPYAETWDELSPSRQRELLSRFDAQLDTEIQKVLNWLDTGKIILTGNKNEDGHYLDFTDNRTDGEKLPTSYERD